MTDTITIPRALLEQALETIVELEYSNCTAVSDKKARDAKSAIRAELAKPVEPVTPVAWIDDFGSVFPIGARKGAESWIESWIAANQRNWKPLYLHPPTPAWCDAPEVATLKAERDAAMKDAERYRWLTTHARTTSEHWGGRWSIVIDGPAPERHGCKDALDEAIDAVIAKAEGRKE